MARVALAFAASLPLIAGCAGHAARTEDARTALDQLQPNVALTQFNEQLEVESAEELPRDVSGDNALFLLDRSMVLQQLGKYELASRDLEVADKQVEMLDFSRDAVDELGKYLFSDDSGPYKAPAYEKLMINTMNLVNYLARGDLNGARIEARRLAVMQKFVSESEDPGQALLGPGSYLAGFTFEKSGNSQEALRYYDEALQHTDYRSLHEPVRRLVGGGTNQSPRLRKILGSKRAAPESSGGDAAASSPSEAPAAPVEAPDKPAEILVIVNFGRVPAKVAKRLPIGLALTYASGALSAGDRSKANYLAGQGLVTWVNYPELEKKKRRRYTSPHYTLDGERQGLEEAFAVDTATREAWDAVKGPVVASAITRMITRAVAGETVRRASGQGLLGALLSLGTQATMSAADTPDTRSWSTLPARVVFGRSIVEPGEHAVELRAEGQSVRKKVQVPAGGWAVVALTVLR